MEKETFMKDHIVGKDHLLSFKERSIYSFNSFDLQVLNSVKYVFITSPTAP